MKKSASSGPDRLKSIYLAGVAGRRPLIPTNGRDLERAAQQVMAPEAYAYVAGAAGRESTSRENLNAFERYRILPRMLKDVSSRDISVNLFGRRWPSPYFICPVGVLDWVRRDADLLLARAADEMGWPLLISNQASAPMESVCAAAGETPRWFQLYWSTSDELVQSFLQRAERSGCEAVVVTLDTTMLGWRCRDLDLAWLPFLRGMGIAQYSSDPVFMRLLRERAHEDDAEPVKKTINWNSIGVLARQLKRHPGSFLTNLRNGEATRAVQLFTRIYSRPSLNWDDITRLRDMTKMRIVLKGIQHPQDAKRALDAGVDAILVSNHGGRQVDGAIATLDALPAVVKAVAGRVPVLLDSGIRSGADALKALSLGASAVGIGRPYVYALALGGMAGAQELFQNLEAEFDLTLGLSGYTSVAELGPECLAPDLVSEA